MSQPQKLQSYSPNLAQSLLGRFIIVALFSVAFGYIEAAVVVYLREIFHPDGYISAKGFQ